LIRAATPARPEELHAVLGLASVISDLERVFEIGFLFVLVFEIIDLEVASVLKSIGAIMLPPVVVCCP
jgi:flagellar biosynthesis protein FliP